ncbi:MAG: arginine--tRNA ligase [Alphaproteobacteria bacterium]|nr:arginine--tRNA ligase [Alphaproteobacteria bacterium]
MSLSLENMLNKKLENIFAALGLDTKFAFAKVSDRPDLSDFQCNGALALAKSERKNPREIATLIATELQKDSDLAKVSVDGPGFLNITLDDAFIAKTMNEAADDERFGVQKTTTPRKIVMDFGGPNVAKALHVGHLRSAVIGESLRRIEEFVGHDVVSDVHLGDWGTQMGMILAEIILQDGDLSKTETYNIDEISAFYKQANARCKENEAAKENARKITAELQNGDPVYRKAWQHLRKESLEAIKKNYLVLDAHFDLWLGESDAHDASGKIVEMAKDQGLAKIDDGALIIRLADDSKPPVILVKSDGGFGYQVTDIATIKMRVDDLQAQEILYVVDKRQALHFEQVFEVAEKLGIAPNVKFKHIGFGTVNGADGKPFKTRDGGVMNLEDLIALSLEKVKESLPEEAEGYTNTDIEKMAEQIAIGAIKFQDLKNNTASGYVFELEDFAKFEGKTGPYIQYAIARINSILRKAGMEPKDVVITNKEERDLALKIAQLNSVIARAEAEKEPSIISDYAYNLAQVFSSFYNASSILNEPNKEVAASRLKLAKLVRDILQLNLYLMGIEAPEAMLKK